LELVAGAGLGVVVTGVVGGWVCGVASCWNGFAAWASAAGASWAPARAMQIAVVAAAREARVRRGIRAG
jgi:hypothetical protein